MLGVGLSDTQHLVVSKGADENFFRSFGLSGGSVLSGRARTRLRENPGSTRG